MSSCSFRWISLSSATDLGLAIDKGVLNWTAKSSGARSIQVLSLGVDPNRKKRRRLGRH